MAAQRIALYPGTFDPVTNGHIDIVERACSLFDLVRVTIAVNPAKQPMFSVEERLEFLRVGLGHLKNVQVDSFSGLVVDHARNTGASAIIRGLRAISDFEYEFQMALMNRKLNEDISTVFLMPHEKYTYLNSSIIRSLTGFNADVSEFVPPIVLEALKKFAGKGN